jgi:hypothetical protein
MPRNGERFLDLGVASSWLSLRVMQVEVMPQVFRLLDYPIRVSYYIPTQYVLGWRRAAELS